MSESLRVDTSDLISAALVIGDTGHGVLGSMVPSEGASGPGYLYAGLSLPADANKEVRGLVTRWPTLGTFAPAEDSSFTYDGATDYALYQLYVDGVASTTDIGYGAGIGRIDFVIGAGGGSLSGAVQLDPAVAAGTLAGPNVSILSGGPTLAPVTAGGSLQGQTSLLPGRRRVEMPDASTMRRAIYVQ